MAWDRWSVDFNALSTENIFQPNRAWSDLERTLLGPKYNRLNETHKNSISIFDQIYYRLAIPLKPIRVEEVLDHRKEIDQKN